MEEKKTGCDAFQWAYDKYVAHDPTEVALYEEERVKADIAQEVYDLRNQAGLSRAQLGDLLSTTETIIEDIEEADYDGDYLAMASRIANALHRRLEVRFVPVEGANSAGTPV